jgi:hypothetical protein
LFSKGLKRVIEANKTSLDLTVEYNSEVLGSCKEALKAWSMPGLFLFDLAEQTFVSYVSLQKSLLDLAVEPGTAMTKAAPEYVQKPSKARAGIGKLIEQPEVVGTPVTDSVQRGVETVVEAQKEIRKNSAKA